MLFSGLPFLYYFLPVVLLCYFLAPASWKNGVLLLSSLVFYGWGEPKYLLLMLCAILLFYLVGIAIEGASGARRKGWLVFAVGTGCAMLAVFKYADFFIASFNAVTRLSLPLLRLALPIGISFYTFQCMSYAVDVYRGAVPAQRDLVAFGTYVAMFPQLIAGPIVRYVDIAPRLTQRKVDAENVYLGARRFLTGLGKKILLANQLGELTAHYRQAAEPSVLFAWMYGAAFMLHIYFDFSGYSDMAIGLGRVFGFRFLENFNYPYLSKSITEFWRRWHMSLGSWFRDYVYIPLGGNRVPGWKWVRNILVVWMLTGLWHGASWNFVLWGLLFALLLLAEKKLPLGRMPGVLRHGYVLLVVMASFVLFNAESIRQAGQDLAALAGWSGLPLVSRESLYYLRSFALVLVFAVVGATPIPKEMVQRIPLRLLAVLEPLAMGGILLLSTAYLVDGSFNPFLYFRF